MDWIQQEGRIIDARFRLRRYLGGRSRAAVFLSESDGKKAVVKLVALESGEAEAWLLRRELAAGIIHPGLLPLYHYGQYQLDHSPAVYSVLEYAEEDLAQVIPSRALSPEEAADVLRAVIPPLQYLHEQGFVHSRLTLSNILAVDDQVKLSSDSLLRIGEPAEDPLPDTIGPPEMRSGLTPASDVWQLGMVLVEILTQHPPAWDGPGHGDPVVPSDLPQPFLDIARQCLVSDPRRRCSLADVRNALDPPAPAPAPVVAEAPARPVRAEAPPPVKVSGPTTARPLRGRMLAWSLGILAVVIIAGAVLKNKGSSPAPQPVPQTAAPAPKPVDPPPPKPKPFDAPGKENLPNSTPAPAVPTPAQQKTGEILPNAETPAPASPAETASSADVVQRVSPTVPPEYLRTIHGLVTVGVQVEVDAAGSVVSARIASGNGGRYFDRVAVENARKWKFAPSPQKTHLLRFVFRQTGVEVSAQK